MVYFLLALECLVLLIRNIMTPISIFVDDNNEQYFAVDMFVKLYKIYLYDFTDFLTSLMILNLFHYLASRVQKPIKDRRNIKLVKDSVM
jgi:hypothetical protein